MKNKIIHLILPAAIILTALPVFAAGQVETVKEQPSEWSKSALRVDGGLIIDPDGNSVPLGQYGKIVYISPGAVETAYMIGAEETIAAIGTTRSSIWPEEKTSKLESIGSLTKPNLEKVVALQPDLVIINAMINDFGKTLRQKGFKTLEFSSDSIADILQNTKVLGILTEHGEEANILIAERNRKLDAVKEKLKDKPLGLKGAFMYAANPIKAFGPETLPGQILLILGVDNIAAGTVGDTPILTPEYILQQNPDFLFGAMSLRKVEDIMEADKVIAATRAGKEGNIWLVPSNKILRPTPRIVDSIEELYEQLSQLK